MSRPPPGSPKWFITSRMGFASVASMVVGACFWIGWAVRQDAQVRKIVLERKVEEELERRRREKSNE